MFDWIARRKLRKEASLVAAPWAGSPYYADAEQWTFIFWREEGLFRKAFEQLDLRNVIELASGHGRHAEQCAGRCGQLTLLDVFNENVEASRKRLAGCGNVSYLKCNGYDFQPLAAGRFTAIYCYDAMVHFSPDLVASYLRDGTRVLAKGGRMLLHHSNYNAPGSERLYGHNPGARNHMTFELFTNFARGAGLDIVSSTAFRWAEVDDLDRLTLLEKPARD